MDSRSLVSNNNGSNGDGAVKANASVDSTSTFLSPLQWFHNQNTNGERLNFPDFVAAIGYWCEQDAHDTFMNLLSTSALLQRVLIAACNEYEVWRRNGGKEFWASRANNITAVYASKENCSWRHLQG
jgi:hypothetical protein